MLLPTVETDGTAKGAEYYYKQLCLYAAGDNVINYERFYFDDASSDVWDYIAVKKAQNFVPERK